DILHGWDNWAATIEGVSEGNPVVFTDSFREASWFTFYGDEPTTSMNTIYHYRRNQFDFSDLDRQLMGKKVLLLSSQLLPRQQILQTDFRKTYKYTLIDTFAYFPKIHIKTEENKYTVETEDVKQKITIPITLTQQPYTLVELETAGMPTLSCFYFDEDNEAILKHSTKITVQDIMKKGDKWELNLPIPDEVGQYELRFGWRVGEILPTRNGLCTVEVR
ncbi:MAG: hypothetical protein ACPGXL_08680, partial [Chitinophagales bacterium]